MDSRSWRQWGFGRHVVLLPADASVADTYVLDDKPIEWLRGVDRSALRNLVEARERELKSQVHRAGGSMFLERTHVGTDSVVLFSWEDDRLRMGRRKEVYWLTREGGRVFRHIAIIGVDRRDAALDLAKQMQQVLVPRENSDIPDPPGFCIDGGFIEGERAPYRESYSVVVRFPTLPRVTLTISSEETGRPQEPLFDRMPGGLAALAGLAAGMRTLRKREFQLGGQKAQEMLLRIPAEGKRAYHFQLEAPGVADSTADPYIVIELNTTHTLDADGHVGDAAFRDDDEALAFWDAIVQSFRLRPGAV